VRGAVGCGDCDEGPRQVGGPFDFKEIFSAFRHLQTCHFLELGNTIIANRNVTKVADFGIAGPSYNSLMQTFIKTSGFSSWRCRAIPG
jgi:hypothetical protein